MAVLCVVVATGADGQQIEEVAREAARDNPVGRKVVNIGEPECPPDEQLQEWTQGSSMPGALFIRANGSLFAVLSVAEAKNFPAVDLTFARAAQ
jgi:hypothetical protein